MRPPARTLLSGLACALTLTLGLACQAPAADDQAPARQLLDDVIRAYQHLGAYSDQGEFALSATVDGKSQTLQVPLKLSLARPNKLRLDTGQVLVVCDGKTLTTAVDPFKKYTVAPAPQSLTFDTFRAGPLGSILFGGPSNAATFILLNLLVGTEPAKAIGELGGVLVLDADRTVGETSCKALRIDQEQGPDIRLLVDPQSKLLKGIDMVLDPKELAEKGLKVSIERFGWAPGAITTKDLPASTFAYTPPQGFAKVESLAQAGPGAGENQYKINALVGKPAPDFTLTVLDGAGKTKTLTKADLAGKVVMIDFWATWCGPCMMELPEVQKLIEAYARDKKDVRIVALSEDDEPKEMAELRGLVEKTLVDKKIKLTGTPVGLVGLDPSHSVGEAFQVEGYPTVVLLDAKGVVQAAHVGVPNGDVSAVGRVLGGAIDTLLAGKPLAPRAEEAAADGPEKDKK
jgi:thiol-disulfide isomerase/thioredoxin/outer membrane lipoprotein-sorting protein